MKTNRIFYGIIFSVVALLALTACGRPTSADVALPEIAADESAMSTALPDPTATPQPTEPPVYETTITAHLDNENVADLRVVNLVNGEEVLSLTLENIYLNHYHGNEYHNSSLYIVNEFGNDQDGWTRELWKYDAAGLGAMLFSAQSIDFRVAPDESFIAIVYPLADDFGGEALVFLDAQGNIVQQYTPDTERLSLSLEKWSQDGRAFWGAYQAGPTPLTFYKVGTDSWQFTAFDVAELPVQHDYDLNAAHGKLVYSDYPVFFEVMGYHRFLVSQEPVTLYVYDLYDQSVITIASSASKSFNPTWLENGMIEYYDPEGNGRLIHDLASNTTTLLPGEPNEDEIFPQTIPLEFELIMPALVLSGVSPMLPPAFPVEEGLPAVYPYIYVAENGRYEISLDYGEDCQGAGACHYGSLAARSIGAGGGADATMMPFFSDTPFMMLPLSQNIPGYFVESACGANCSDAQIFWIYAGFEYMLGMKGASQEDLIALANATLENSLP